MELSTNYLGKYRYNKMLAGRCEVNLPQNLANCFSDIRWCTWGSISSLKSLIDFNSGEGHGYFPSKYCLMIWSHMMIRFWHSMSRLVMELRPVAVYPLNARRSSIGLNCHHSVLISLTIAYSATTTTDSSSYIKHLQSILYSCHS